MYLKRLLLISRLAPHVQKTISHAISGSELKLGLKETLMLSLR